MKIYYNSNSLLSGEWKNHLNFVLIFFFGRTTLNDSLIFFFKSALYPHVQSQSKTLVLLWFNIKKMNCFSRNGAKNHKGCFVCFKLLCSFNSKPCIQLDLDVWVSFFIAIHQRFHWVNNRTAKYDKQVKVSEGLWSALDIMAVSYNNSTVRTVCQHFVINYLLLRTVAVRLHVWF